MKRIIKLGSALLMLALFAGCNSKTTTKKNSTTLKPTSDNNSSTLRTTADKTTTKNTTAKVSTKRFWRTRLSLFNYIFRYISRYKHFKEYY